MRERTRLLKSAAKREKAANRSIIDLDKAFPRHNPGPWPEGFTLSREEIYDEEESDRYHGGPLEFVESTD